MVLEMVQAVKIPGRRSYLSLKTSMVLDVRRLQHEHALDYGAKEELQQLLCIHRRTVYLRRTQTTHLRQRMSQSHNRYFQSYLHQNFFFVDVFAWIELQRSMPAMTQMRPRRHYRDICPEMYFSHFWTIVVLLLIIGIALYRQPYNFLPQSKQETKRNLRPYLNHRWELMSHPSSEQTAVPEIQLMEAFSDFSFGVWKSPSLEFLFP
jgi:hypothetical protein